MSAALKRQSLNRFGKVLSLAVIACAAVFGLAQQSVAAPPADAERPTGAVRPTDEQKAWEDAAMIRIQAIRPNALGLQRANAERSRRGKKPLTARDAGVAAVGNEISGTTSEEPASATAPAATGTTGGTAVAAALPATVNNTTLKYFPPIRSQGSLGSCAQFSAVYYTLTHMTAMARDWDAKNGGDSYRFSPKWTYNMVNGGVDGGSWHTDAYAIAQKHGLATWAEFPYDSNYRQWCTDGAVWQHAISFRANQTGKVSGLDTDAGLAQLKQLLANGYVLNFATYIYSWQYKTIGNDPSTTADDALVGQNCAILSYGTSGGHAMTIVGYNDDIWVDINGNGAVDSGEKGALLIANSWGSTWNGNGMVWVAYDALKPVSAVTGGPTARNSEGLFWYKEACWVTARPTYQPTLVAKFTLNAALRNQISMTLGVSSSTGTQPSSYWYPTIVLANAGGAYAFDGTTTACDGTFCLDFSDLAAGASGPMKYYLSTKDNASGSPTAVKSFQLLDLTYAIQTAAAGLPVSVDASTLLSAVLYDTTTGDIPPTAQMTATPTSGYLPLTVAFDASTSTDADGTIAAYDWNFGDGVLGTGITVSHTYTTAGTFTAVLTVTDDKGAKSTKSVAITVTDPSILAAPSNLSASAVTGGAKLKWTDNSGSETGFAIERAPQGSRGFIGTFVQIATTAANATTYTDSVKSGTYYYRVKAVNSATGKSSAYSNTVSIKVR